MNNQMAEMIDKGTIRVAAPLVRFLDERGPGSCLTGNSASPRS